MSRHRPTAALLLVGALLLGWWILRGEEPAAPLLQADAPVAQAERAAPPLLAGRGVKAPPALPDFSKPSAMRNQEPLKAGPGQVLLQGHVRDETGAGVAGSRITVRPPPEHNPGGFIPINFFARNVFSESDGRFECVVPESRPSLLVAGPTHGASASAEQLVEPTVSSVTLRVQRTPNLGGLVLDPHGAPALFELVIIRAPGWREPQMCQTSREGRFVTRVAPNTREVAVQVGLLEGDKLPAGSALGDRLYDVEVGRMDLILRLQEMAFIRGTVEGSDGVALRSGSVYARRVGGGPAAVKLAVGIDGKTGRFTLGPLRTGAWALVALPTRGEYAMSEDTVITGPTDEAVVVCSTTPGIHGRIEGEDVEDFNVTCVDPDSPIGVRRRGTKVAADGSFHIQWLRHAPHRLYVWRRGDRRMAQLRAVRPHASPLSIDLERGLVIAGSFRGGKTQKGRRVIAKQGNMEVDILADENGRFRVMGLGPGEWRLHKVNSNPNAAWLSGPGRVIYAGTANVLLDD